MTPQEFFSPAHYKRYLYACELGEKLKKYCEEDCWLVESDGFVVRHWSVDIKTSFTSNGWTVISYKVANTTISLIDIVYDDNNKPWLPTKKEIEAIFRELALILPKDIKKF